LKVTVDMGDLSVSGPEADAARAKPSGNLPADFFARD
jgi:hypothetical protein